MFPEAKSAKDLYEKQRLSRRIITFCQDVDRILGGGVATSQVTEFCKRRSNFVSNLCPVMCLTCLSSIFFFRVLNILLCMQVASLE